MCGIVGLIGENICFDESQILFGIKHRGPDGLNFENYSGVFLGHSRLAIQDLTQAGTQPMVSDDGRYVIIFNGEIYNHNDLRDEFLSKRTFESKSDTETLLYLFALLGTDSLNLLNGIFSFAILDKYSNEITIVRDQFGVKPLYYYSDENMFWFSSEIKSILSTQFDKSISGESLVNYLSFLYSPGELTPFHKVKKLLPGHYIKLSLSEPEMFSITRYYDIPFDNTRLNRSEDELINDLDNLLLKAVERQMLSDVPVGFFLSGGLDSSAIVAMARKLYPNRRFDCYTASVNYQDHSDEGFTDDLPFAREVAEYLNVNLIEVDCNINIVSEFGKMIHHLDEPQADSAPLNVLKICERARLDGNTVLLGGTAGDDVFSGYRRHQALRYDKYISVIPLSIRKVIRKLCQKLPNNSAKYRRIKKFTRDVHLSENERLVGYFEWLDHKTITNLFSDEYKVKIAGYNPLNFHFELLNNLADEKDKLNQMLYLELKTFLVDHNLNYTDKMSMATGIEVRVPFLDKDLVEFSTKIPTHLKLKGVSTKYILRKVMERYLPKHIIYRSKSGFGGPLRSWIINDLDDKITELLSKENIEGRGIFNYETIRKLIIDNKLGKIDASYSIWCLLAIEKWMQIFYDKPSADK
jgi:asparagine synthase (glutamine-hydrolysing)